MRPALGLAAAALTAGLGGCAGTGGQPNPTGRSLFAQDCGVCHSLTGRQSPRRQGGDLLDLQVDRVAMLEFTREMPVRRRLSASQLRTVADYVLAVERSHR